MRTTRRTPRGLPSLLALLAIVAPMAGCGAAGPGGGFAQGKLRVVAAESFWGSIASQLGGGEVSVRSIVVNPAADPHSYEPTVADARTVAEAQLAIVNGIGYDEWASHLLAADPSRSRAVLDVGRLLGLGRGENPHQWYSPARVHAVVARMTADLQRLRPADAGYFARRRRSFETAGLAEYDRLIAEIRSRYGGVPVGYSESVFQPLGEALGLRLLTPPAFARAIAEGAEATARDQQIVERQIVSHRIEVWVFNTQNLTPEVQQATRLARSAHVPVVAVTETLSPAGASFQQWQVAQLRRLRDALRRATGR